jgi:hypothetical protein
MRTLELLVSVGPQGRSLEEDTWEAGGDRKTIAHREREHNNFFVLYDVKHLRVGSGCRRIETEDSCE